MSTDVHAHSHEPGAIAERLSRSGSPSYVGDAVLGAIDGSVTTVAIIAGALGAQLTGFTVIALGVANLLADGLSMAVGNYQRVRSDRSHAAMIKKTEERHIDLFPEGEREEVRQIFARKGFTQPLLEEIVTTITSNREHWVETMMSDEWGVGSASQNPMRVALVTFAAFVAVGCIPLIPFFGYSTTTVPIEHIAAASGLIAAFSFAAIGVWRARVFAERPLIGGLETLITGGGAALIAFVVSRSLGTLLNI